MSGISREVNDAILEHMMNPKNYGKMDNPSSIGFGYSDKTNEYVITYLDIDNELINDVKFMAVGCTDTIVSGSIFTQMIKGSNIEFGNKSAKKLMKNLENAPESQRACAEIVIKSYEAALINLKNRLAQSNEELHKLKINNGCEIKENDNV